MTETATTEQTMLPLDEPPAEMHPVSTNIQAHKVHSGEIGRKRGKFVAEKIEADFTGRFTYGWIPTDALLVDPEYQRKLIKYKISKIAHAWDQNKVGIFVVNHRTATGQYFVIDGQHRHAAMQLIENYPSHVFCQIFQGLTPEQEAQMFHDLDSERDNLTPGASFTALLAAKNPVAMGIKTVAESIGYTVNYTEGPHANNLRAFKTLQDIYRRVGASGLTRILQTARMSWPNKSEATSEPMLRGLELFFQKYPTADDTRLVKVLSQTTPIFVIATARRIQEDLSSVIYAATAQTIRGLYNKGLRYKLPEWGA